MKESHRPSQQRLSNALAAEGGIMLQRIAGLSSAHVAIQLSFP